ncbi:MAG: hypothetical protein ACOCX4_09265 [Planctomycetota bacterium]
MRLTTYVLFVTLLSLLGLLAVHEEARRVRCGYQAAKLLAERDRLRLAVLDREAEIAALTTPQRLARWNEKLGLDLAPVRPLVPPTFGAGPTARAPEDG